MTLIDENMAEQACLGWFEVLGYEHAFGPDLAPGGDHQERESYKQIVLEDRFRQCLGKLNPGIPGAVLEDVARQVIHGNAPRADVGKPSVPPLAYRWGACRGSERWADPRRSGRDSSIFRTRLTTTGWW